MSPAGHGRREQAGPSPIGDLASARDRALARRLTQRGDRAAEALAVLFQTYAPVAWALAVRVTRQNDLAEDVVQEAFLALWRAPDSYDSRRGTVRAYLLTAVHHLAVDVVRREQAQRRRRDDVSAEYRSTVPDVAVEVTDRAEGRQRGEAVAAALAALPAEQRQVLHLMYFDGRTQQCIAEQLDLPLGTVKSRALLAMRKLRAALVRPDGRGNS